VHEPVPPEIAPSAGRKKRLVRFNVKTFAKYLLIILAGSAIGALALGLDAEGSFIPQRMCLRAGRIGKWAFGRLAPSFEKCGASRPVRVLVEPGVSLLLDPADLVARDILIRNVWQPEVWQSISDGLSTGGVFLDVGAHIGYDTLKASVRVGPSGKVISFEPNPNTLKELNANIAASHAANVTVEPIACTDKEQTLTLFDSTSEGNSGGSSLSLANADMEGKGTLPSYTVKGRPIDEVVRELGLTRLDVVKVDVEGAEYLVLRGARETLQRFHPKIVMEMIPSQLANMNTSVEELLALIKELGYGQGKQLEDTDWEWTVR
jgi:FkbM family methyltransferase